VLSVITPEAVASPLRHLAGLTVTVNPSPSPAFPGDAPDPNVVYNAGTYYAFTTGTALGNSLQALVDTSGSPASGWRSYTGGSSGSTALPFPPSWEQPGTQTSPAVFHFDGRWIMYYDAARSGYAGDTGHNCLSVATATTLTPSDPIFTDTSTGPLLCDTSLGGAIDPSPFLDPATGQAYLIWKSNDGGSVLPAYIWSAPLSANGMSLAGPPTELMYNNTVEFPWELTIENPDMVLANGVYYLLLAAGIWDSSNYSEAIATCSGPSGPCVQTQATPILSSYGPVLGPGGGSFFQDASGNWWLAYAAWTAPCTNYSCGGARELYVTPVDLSGNGPVEVNCTPPVTPSGYVEAASDGGVFAFGNAAFCGSTGGMTLNAPVVGIAEAPGGNGYYEVASDGGIFSFGPGATFYGSMGGQPLNAPIVGIAEAPGGNGYYEVASDGGIFSFGPGATFYGSMGGQPLNAPIVGIAAVPGGNGYYEVASDGGIFSFGPGATFYGSMGGKPLNKPIVGIAAVPGGNGYYEVASDGGIFSFGPGATFYGSMGGKALNKPIVGIAAVPGGNGYYEVASDGGIFSFGPGATFYGSMGGQPLNKPIVGIA
jgi:hypothetical protein